MFRPRKKEIVLFEFYLRAHTMCMEADAIKRELYLLNLPEAFPSYPDYIIEQLIDD